MEYFNYNSWETITETEDKSTQTEEIWPSTLTPEESNFFYGYEDIIDLYERENREYCNAFEKLKKWVYRVYNNATKNTRATTTQIPGSEAEE